MSWIRATLVGSAIAGLVLVWAYGTPEIATAVPFEKGTVRLYSDGKVVGEWESVGAGRVEGDTFVFSVQDGVQDLKVRIRGTFTYESRS